jgi:hypothetical protein
MGKSARELAEETALAGRAEVVKAQQTRQRRWLVWQRIGTPFLAPTMALSGALGGVVVGSILDDEITTVEPRTQIELAFDANRLTYASLMSNLQQMISLEAKMSEKHTACVKNIDEMFFQLDPFLDKKAGDQLWTDLREFENITRGLINEKTTDHEAIRKTAVSKRDAISKQLKDILFVSKTQGETEVKTSPAR